MLAITYVNKIKSGGGGVGVKEEAKYLCLRCIYFIFS